MATAWPPRARTPTSTSICALQLSEHKHGSRCKCSTRKECRAQKRTVGLTVGNPRGRSPLEVVLEATAFSLTSDRVEYFTMEFSTFFFSVVVELWDWASMTPSHYFSSGRPGTPTKTAAPSISNKKGKKEIPLQRPLHLSPEEVPGASANSKSGSPLPAGFLAKRPQSASNKPGEFCLHVQKEEKGTRP